MRRFLTCVFLAMLASGAAAAPRDYVLDSDGTQVVFTWYLGGDAVSGHIPVKSADVTLDFDRAANSLIDVALDVTRAEAGLAFATGTMRGPKVLDAGTHPEIRFRSTKVTPQGAGARFHGDLTIRGVTLPADFDVTLYKGKGDPAQGRLAIQITGAVSRSAFGATGWSDMVRDVIEFNILAHMTPKG